MRVIFVNFRRLDLLIADPGATVNLFVKLGTPFGRSIDYSRQIVPEDPSLRNVMMLVHNFSVTTFILLFVATISRAISTIALSLLVLGIPIVILWEWRAKTPFNDSLAVTSFLWLVFMSVSLAFSMVHIEMRHALPVLPAALVCVVYTLQWLRAGFYHRTLGKQLSDNLMVDAPRASVTADVWIGVALRVGVFMVLIVLIVIIALASPGDRLLSVAVIALAVTLIRWAGVSGKRVWLYVGLLLLLAKPIF